MAAAVAAAEELVAAVAAVAEVAVAGAVVAEVEVVVARRRPVGEVGAGLQKAAG